MQPALWQKLYHLTDHLINVFETVNQPTYCEQLPVILAFDHMLIIGAISNIVEGWGLETVPTA